MQPRFCAPHNNHRISFQALFCLNLRVDSGILSAVVGLQTPHCPNFHEWVTARLHKHHLHTRLRMSTKKCRKILSNKYKRTPETLACGNQTFLQIQLCTVFSDICSDYYSIKQRGTFLSLTPHTLLNYYMLQSHADNSILKFWILFQSVLLCPLPTFFTLSLISIHRGHALWILSEPIPFSTSLPSLTDFCLHVWTLDRNGIQALCYGWGCPLYFQVYKRNY